MKKQWTITDPQFLSDRLNNKLQVSPWEGHRNFVYDFVNYMKPGNIIELGTHFGCSFFAMAQSIKDNNLKTKLYAVDTWEGDEQAGYYGEDVFELVNLTVKDFFMDIKIELKRMLFDEALNDFKDNFFNIIHIDGFHSYEAVSNDFYKWLPKLCENGVILLHDVASHLNYGTNIFWNELKLNPEYKCFEFNHSWGLGVVFPKGLKIYDKLTRCNMMDKVMLYQYKAMFNLNEIKLHDLEQMVTGRDETIKAQTLLIDERDKALASEAKMIKERDKAIMAQAKSIDSRDKAIADQILFIDERDKIIEAQTSLINVKDEAIAAQTIMIEERDRAIVAQTILIVERDKAIAAQTILIEERDKAILAQTALIDERDKAILAQTALIDERDALIKEISK